MHSPRHDSNAVPVVERDVVRVVVLDNRERILLLHIRDGSNPAFGTTWELPGGGIEAGENYADAVARELREETGIEIARNLIGTPTWRRYVAYTYRGERRVQHERVVAVRLGHAAPRIVPTNLCGFENDDQFENKWWSALDITASRERFYPRSLPVLLPQFLAGEIIDEPFEYWP